MSNYKNRLLCKPNKYSNSLKLDNNRITIVIFSQH